MLLEVVTGAHSLLVTCCYRNVLASGVNRALECHRSFRSISSMCVVIPVPAEGAPSFITVLNPVEIKSLLHRTCHCIYVPFLSRPLPFSLILCLTLPTFLFFFLSVLPTSSALRSCSTGDSLLSSASIRSAKSAPALAPPLPVLLHHHHPLLPPLADQLAGTHSLYYLPAFLWTSVSFRLKYFSYFPLF